MVEIVRAVGVRPALGRRGAGMPGGGSTSRVPEWKTESVRGPGAAVRHQAALDLVTAGGERRVEFERDG